MSLDNASAPLVSFCMSTFKRGSTLLDTLKSIQRQSYQNFEVIISDNDVELSGKAFVELLNDQRFKYFGNGQNLGMKPSFNKSIERSSGKYIVMIADDDPVYYDMLETLVDLKERYPDRSMYMGGCDWFCTHPETAGMYHLKVGTNSCLSNRFPIGFIQDLDANEFLKEIFSVTFYSHYLWSTCMVKKSVIMKFGGTPDYGTPFFGDYAYLSTMGSVDGCVLINKSLGCQTLHQENFGRNQHEQLITAAINFPAYLTPKFEHLRDWPLIKKSMYHFMGSSLAAHISFLYNYFDNKKIKVPELRSATKKVFALPHMKPYYKKFIIKRDFPFLHDQLVRIKRNFKSKNS